MLLHRKDYFRAHTVLGIVIQLNPRLTEAYVNRSYILHLQGDLDGVINDSSKAIDLNPHLVAAWIDRPVSRTGKGDLKGALSDFDRA